MGPGQKRAQINFCIPRRCAFLEVGAPRRGVRARTARRAVPTKNRIAPAKKSQHKYACSSIKQCYGPVAEALLPSRRQDGTGPLSLKLRRVRPGALLFEKFSQWRVENEALREVGAAHSGIAEAAARSRLGDLRSRRVALSRTESNRIRPKAPRGTPPQDSDREQRARARRTDKVRKMESEI